MLLFTDIPFSRITTLQCGWTRKMLVAGIETRLTFIQNGKSSAQPH